MKFIKIFLIGCLLAGITIFSACERELADEIAYREDPTDFAYFKFYNAAVNSARTHIFVDNAKVTGNVATSSGSVFPVSSFYSAITRGDRSFVIRDTLATTTQNVISTYQNYGRGKNYTVFLYDSTNNVKVKVVEDTLVVPTDTTARIRFANFVYSGVAMPNLDLFSIGKQTNVFTDISKTTVTGFIPYASQPDSFYVRPTGTTTNLAILTITPMQKRSYTLVFRGRYQDATGTNARTLSAITHN